MNKAIKGALAAAIAGILLLGGYGTFAYWSDSAPLDGGQVNSGELALSDPAAGVWTDVSDGGAGTVIPTIADFDIVPGDVLTYTTSATITATGDNLEATLAADPASITGDAELLADVDVTTDVEIAGAPVTTITDANDNDTVDVTVTLTFDSAAEDGQLQSLDLTNLALTLTQNPR